MSRHKKNTAEIEAICNMIKAGRTNIEIALALNLPETSIDRFRRTYNMTPEQVFGYLADLTPRKSCEIKQWLVMQQLKQANGCSAPIPAQMPLPAREGKVVDTNARERLDRIWTFASEINERLIKVEKRIEGHDDIIAGSDERTDTVSKRIEVLEQQLRAAVVLMQDIACDLAVYLEHQKDEHDEMSRAFMRQMDAANIAENAIDGHRAAIGRLIAEIDHEDTEER